MGRPPRIVRVEGSGGGTPVIFVRTGHDWNALHLPRSSLPPNKEHRVQKTSSICYMPMAKVLFDFASLMAPLMADAHHDYPPGTQTHRSKRRFLLPPCPSTALLLPPPEIIEG